MKRLFASAWVIARRDYVATVFSPIFLLFLIGPLFPILFGGIFNALGNGGDGPLPRPIVALVTDASATGALLSARARLVARLGDDALPDLAAQPQSDADGQAVAHRLLTRPGPGGHPYAAVLVGPLAHPRFFLSNHAPAGLGDDVGLLLDTARATVALGSEAPPPVALVHQRVSAPPTAPTAHDRIGLARGAQTLLFFLIVLLAGMSLSTFVEEKSNKVIEVLAAAVPVDAIFLGKLGGMLAISLTGVAVWGATAAAAVFLLFPGLIAHLVAPAVGWPVFWLLGLVYFIASYLLLGAVFLGLGSQAGSPREIQVLAMPATMMQLLLFGFASAGVPHPEGWMAKAAAIFPWSSPLAMIGRAAELPALWPHLLAILWQLMWLAVALRLAASLFRSAVLKSGSQRRWWGGRAARA
jgi:ABC-2 type transport system permease protein